MMRTAYQNAHRQHELEFLYYIDSDDPKIFEYQSFKGLEFASVIIGEPMSVSKSWNILAAKCMGDYLMMGNDDLIFKSEGWDRRLVEEAETFSDGIFVIWFDDGLNAEKHCAFPVISRKWYETLGKFTPGIMRFGYNDTWIMDVGKRVGRLHYVGDVKLEHLHFSKGHPKDETTKRNRNAGQWGSDRKTFNATADARQLEAQKLMEVMGEDWNHRSGKAGASSCSSDSAQGS